MNKHILIVIDNQLNPDKYTEEQLEQNAKDADNATYDDAAYIATATASAAYACTYDAAYVAAVDYWLNQYFKSTGENKQDYIDALENKL